MSDIRVLSGPEVAEHANRESCWIIVHGKVYDVTEFLPEHPGGQAIILKYAGKDATEAYEPIHPPDAITTNLPPDKHLGVIDASTVAKVVKEVTAEEKQRQKYMEARPSLDTIINLHDFETVARKVISEKAWAYYSSASDDEITLRENRMAYQRVWFRPRILRDVTSVDWSTTILGQKSSLPVYISATALGKLGHPEGELCLTRAAQNHGVIQMIATLASCSFDEMVDAAKPDQPLFLQLYVNKDREITKKYVQHAEARGVKALFITVDAPQLGRREKDMRMKFVVPIILKGIATAEDAILAYESGVQGIVLSNHGGRQLDTARSGLEVLVEVIPALRARGYFPNPNFEIFVDGGVRRASDVLKAIALGATAVGVGRPFLYAFCSYGQDGVEKAIQIFRDEFEMNMRLLGARTIDELVPEMVDASALSSHVVLTPQDTLFHNTYVPLAGATFQESKL
ncbi:hypothetical protein EVJ58_g6927 [Rhodofomes roseus]|uniref:L-lactate dehydrogenase (Cytochrome) n=1 Tax=Rhodofomes roseus TaxID=34475 RepID=A0A4Y9Y6S4_9APHY|nr:hypothetical protein EVJ58_g6927 [Rhodofomes roseus]